LSLTKRKSAKSIIIAPKAPKKAVERAGANWAISPKVTMAGTVVNTEVKNIPAIKLPRYPSFCDEARMLVRTSVLMRRRAMRRLKKIISTSCTR